jgi:hypothetical protein
MQISKKTSILFSLLLLSFFGFSQIKYPWEENENTPHLIQFSGIVVTGDSLKPVPFAGIQIVGTYYGTSSDYNGFFSMVAKAGDVIQFTSIGYRTARYKIPDTLSSTRYTLIQMMQTDTILLMETVIYPWPSLAALEQAIVNIVIPEDDYDRAIKNLTLQELRERGEYMPMDGSMNYRHQMQQIINKSYYNGQYMPYQFLNPFAWAQFIEAWKAGKFKKKD